MIETLKGKKNRPRLLEALKRQTIVADDDDIARELYETLKLQEVGKGEALITQGNDDNDLLLILSGRVSIQVNGREVATRRTGEHIGEMSLIDPVARRAATVVAIEPTVVAKISEP